MKRFFGRYLQRDLPTLTKDDYYFPTVRVPSRGRSPVYKSALRTPALSNRCFVGQEKPSTQAAENSACLAFFLDEEVDSIKRWLVPPSNVFRSYVKTLFWDGTQREQIVNSGIVKKLIQEETIQNLVLLCRAEGCRCALWDGNA